MSGAPRITLKASAAVRTRLQSLGTIPPAAVAEPKVPAAVAEPADREQRIAEAEELHRRFKQREAIHAALVASGAKVFEAPTPLAIGISDAVVALLAGTFDPEDIRHFLQWWTARVDYLQAVARGDARRGLDGEQTGYPDENQRISAAASAAAGWRGAARRVGRVRP